MVIELVPFKSAGAVSYSPSKVTMALSCIVCEIYIIGRKSQNFILHLYLASRKETHLNFVKVFDNHKTRLIGLPCGQGTLMICCFHIMPECKGQTDGRTVGQTDRQNYYINIALQCADAQ